MKELTPKQKDILIEVSNICRGSATTALSQVLKQEIGIKLSETAFVRRDSVQGMFDDSEVLAVEISFFGDVVGKALLYFSKDDAKAFYSSVDTSIDKDSFYKELGNILVNSYLNALSKIAKLDSSCILPKYLKTPLNSLFDSVLDSVGANFVFLVDVSFSVNRSLTKGNLLIVFDDISADKILSSLS